MDTTTKKTIIVILTILQQLANQTYSTAAAVLQSLPEADPCRGTLADVQQSRVGLLRRLDELTHQGDRGLIFCPVTAPPLYLMSRDNYLQETSAIRGQSLRIKEKGKGDYWGGATQTNRHSQVPHSTIYCRSDL